MSPHQCEIETFLIEDAGIGLSNVRAYLEWASATAAAAEDVRLSVESTKIIIAGLRRIEYHAERLHDLLVGSGKPRPVGLEETLRRFQAEAA